MSFTGKGRGKLFEALSQVDSNITSGVGTSDAQHGDTTRQLRTMASDSGVSSDTRFKGHQRTFQSDQSEAVSLFIIIIIILSVACSVPV